MPADCAINSCGVLAVGRCRLCGDAFCETHAATAKYGLPSRNECAACEYVIADTKARRKSEEEFLYGTETLRALVSQMVAAGCGGMEQREHEELVDHWVEQRHGFASLRSRRVNSPVKTTVEDEPAWPIGEGFGLTAGGALVGMHGGTPPPSLRWVVWDLMAFAHEHGVDLKWPEDLAQKLGVDLKRVDFDQHTERTTGEGSREACERRAREYSARAAKGTDELKQKIKDMNVSSW